MTSTAVALRNPYLEMHAAYCVPDELMGWAHRRHGQLERDEDGLKIYAGPVWDRWMDDMTNSYQARDHARRWFGFAVPNAAAIASIAALGKPIVELGAGTGYWAWLGRQAGIPWTPYDRWPRWGNYYRFATSWVPVGRGSERKLTAIDHYGQNRWRDHALMLCWPDYSSPMASDCLAAYQGDTLIYVGEGNGGCCAANDFWLAVEGSAYVNGDEITAPAAWELVTEVAIPRWPGLHDYLTIYRR